LSPPSLTKFAKLTRPAGGSRVRVPSGSPSRKAHDAVRLKSGRSPVRSRPWPPRSRRSISPRAAFRYVPAFTPANANDAATSGGGLAVHIGARIGAMAGPGEVLSSRTVRDLSAGSGVRFCSRGLHRLKGLPEDIELFQVVDPQAPDVVAAIRCWISTFITVGSRESARSPVRSRHWPLNPLRLGPTPLPCDISGPDV
jgi:hypothetical protein